MARWRMLRRRLRMSRRRGVDALIDFLRRNGDYIRLLAYRQSFERDGIVDDLEQAAWIASWELEPTRFDMDNAPDIGYVRRVFKRRMQRLRARLRKQAGAWRPMRMDPLRMQRAAERAVIEERRYNHIEQPWAWREETFLANKAVPARRWRVADDGTLEQVG